MCDRRVQVDDVSRLLLAVQVRIDLLDEGGLAGTSHAWGRRGGAGEGGGAVRVWRWAVHMGGGGVQGRVGGP